MAITLSQKITGRVVIVHGIWEKHTPYLDVLLEGRGRKEEEGDDGTPKGEERRHG